MRSLLKLIGLLSRERSQGELRVVRRVSGGAALPLLAALSFAPALASVVSGVVADGRYPYGALVGVAGASVAYGATSTKTDLNGRFSLEIPDGAVDAVLDIRAAGYVPYRERVSRMVAGAFHLIPEDLYRGVYLLAWQRTYNNSNNWHRKWEQQTEFVIVRTGASDEQIQTLTSILASDEYRRMTGGRFTSSVRPTIVGSKPSGSARYGKTVISFARGIVPGGIAHSEDSNGIISYSEITWDVSQRIGSHIVWHEMVHTVTTGGHNNEWPNVVSEVATTGYVTKTDEEVLNCIYNSPPRRDMPVVQPTGPSQPVVSRGGVLNNASYLPFESLHGGIAQGSVLAIFGRNLGAQGLRRAEAFPLLTEMAGTSVQVSAGGMTVDAYLLYTSPNQVGALLPSGTPAGQGTLTVTYANQTSPGVPIRVVGSAFGIFTQNQGGTGPAVAQNFQAQELQPVNTLVQAAAPKQLLTLWGTGLGPIPGNEAASALPGRPDVEVEVWVGGQAAKVIYAGRSGCCAGIDQVTIEAPPGPLGCYVPVLVRAGGVLSNFATLSLAAQGRFCSDPLGFSDSLLQRLARGTGFRAGVVRLERRSGAELQAGPPPSAERAFAAFRQYPLGVALASQGPLGTVVSRGHCLAFACEDENCLGQDPALSVPQDAGAGLDLRGPVGVARLVEKRPGIYGVYLSGLGEPTFFEPGTYTVSGTGGRTVGSFTASLAMPASSVQWAGEEGPGEVDRTQPLTVNWIPEDSNHGFVGVMGQSVLPGTRSTMAFLCLEDARARQLTVPSLVLEALPRGRGTLSLIEIVPGLDNAFTTDGVDAGYFYSQRAESKSVQFK